METVLPENMSVGELASVLGLNPNTVTRWIENGTMPNHYESDLKRLNGSPGNPVDQFYTNPNVAIDCFKIFNDNATQLGVNLNDYWFIEPSAGCGSFFELFPKQRRIGIDLDPKLECDIEIADYLLWDPPDKRKFVVVGNPPFGLRGHLALQFINYSAKFADIIAFILPQLFESDGKGVPSKRVDKNMQLAYSKKLPSDSFFKPDGTPIAVSTIFQIWTKVGKNHITIQPRLTCKSFLKVYSLSDGGTPSSTRNKKMIDNCDVYLPSTCFNGMKVYDKFSLLPNKRGYGIVIHQQKAEILNLIKNHNWSNTAFKSTNGACNLRTSLIEDVVTQAGFCDK